jgi:hypothetical protein
LKKRIKVAALLSLILLSLHTAPARAAETSTVLDFQVPMNTYCSPSNPVELSFEFVNTRNIAANVTLHLYKKDGTEYKQAGSSYDGIESTVTPGTPVTLTRNAAGLYHTNFGIQQSCNDRVYSGKLVSETDISTLLARGWVDSKHGTERIIVRDDLGTSKPPADTIPPAAVQDLNASSPTASTITLSWTAPGGDGTVGKATYYDIRFSTSMITDVEWDNATQIIGEPIPNVSGSLEQFVVSGLMQDTTYYFVLKSIDEAGNISTLSNVATEKTLKFVYDQSKVTADSYYGSDAPWKVFDGNPTSDPRSFWYTLSTPPTGGHWLKYDFGEDYKKTIRRMSIQSSRLFIIGNVEYVGSVKDWRLFASNDNVNFVEITSGTQLKNKLPQEYTFQNDTAYRYYRINVLNSYHSAQYVAIGELAFFEQ